MGLFDRKTTYPNVANVRRGGIQFAKTPRGKQADLWETVRRQFPGLDGARISTGLGGGLEVEIEPGMGTAQQRMALVEAAAKRYGVAVRKLHADSGEVTRWIVTTVQGIQLIVSTKVNAARDGSAAFRRWS